MFAHKDESGNKISSHPSDPPQLQIKLVNSQAAGSVLSWANIVSNAYSQLCQ